jgi:heat shock protein HtpX
MIRIGLFLITNILVVITVSVILSLLGIGRYTGPGMGLQSLAIFCLVWGMTGSIISLLLSRIMAKWSMGVQVIDRSSPHYGWVVSMVEQLSQKAGLPVTPEVGIYESPEVNAFATGPSQRRALVAFSTGLLSAMAKNEIEGVAAHEIAHIKNGDMVTMTLLQGVMNAFVMFFARIIAFAIAQNVKEESRYMVQFAVTFIAEMVLGLLGFLVVCAFSRWREFRADRGGAQYAGKHDMIAALQRLARNHEMYDQAPSLAAFKISGPRSHLFSTHPPLEVRIKALQQAQV